VDVGPDLMDRLQDERPDVAFIALHGRGGEDGTVQELLELVGIPYTASRPGACIRCMDKVVTKHALRDAGIPTPPFYAFRQSAFEDLGARRVLPVIEERLEFPIVVKPANQGSALGIKFARTATDVPGALVAAFSYDTKVLLERYVDGREIAVSIIEGPDGPQALPVVEAIPDTDGDAFYDFESRYVIGRTRFVCPAELTDELTAQAQALALAVWRTLGCSGFARVDLMLSAEGLTVLEANAIPGLTDTSLLPLAAEAAGIGFDELVARMLDLAVERTAAA
jgi:D-alanine-D-alanine ligase